METTAQRAQVTSAQAGLTQLRLRLFAVMWAAAALFHLAGNPRPSWQVLPITFLIVQTGVGVAAAAILAGIRRRAALAALCVLIPVSAWMEAPIVGNHWVLAAMISLAYLGAAAIGRWRHRDRDRDGDDIWQAFAPTARLVTLIAYSFAAFAKLNSDFFDPSVSCAVYYHDQLVRSWGLGVLSSAGRPALGVAMAVAAAVTELSVPVLLLLRRTRRIGLVLALSFHWLLALDFSQHFWDFSSVLFAGFLLFADDALMRRLRDIPAMVRSQIGLTTRRIFSTATAVAVVATLVTGVAPGVESVRSLAILAGHAAWVFAGTAVVVAVGLSALRSDRAGDRVRLWPATAGMLVLPVVVFLNGLTPYLELKTGFGWNMYSNLRTVAGETNHLLVPSTIDLTGLQSDRVEILESSHDGLAQIIGSGHEIVYSEFREYAHEFPDSAVTYRRGGETTSAQRIGDDPAGQGGISTVSRKVQSFRTVNADGPEPCQSVFTPAR